MNQQQGVILGAQCAKCSPTLEAKNMDFETFKLIIEQNKQLIKIKLQKGEPLVNKNLFEMVDYAKNFGIVQKLLQMVACLLKKIFLNYFQVSYLK